MTMAMRKIRSTKEAMIICVTAAMVRRTGKYWRIMIPLQGRAVKFLDAKAESSDKENLPIPDTPEQ
jgi:hypothetical protein